MNWWLPAVLLLQRCTAAAAAKPTFAASSNLLQNVLLDAQGRAKVCDFGEWALAACGCAVLPLL
jgi:hypothetical protein